MTYFMHLTQVLYRLKVFYMAAFDPQVDPLMMQPSVRLFAGHTPMASAEAKMPMGKPA
jgi:hypothetical protein